jgi:hypothetical protein
MKGAHKIVGWKPEGRQPDDFYATPAWAVEELLKREPFPLDVWEPASGDGAISKVLERAGYSTYSSDIRTEGVYGEGGKNYFFENRKVGAIITNPPFKSFLNFALKANAEAEKVALFARVQILEGKERYAKLWSRYPPKRVWVFSERVNCLKDGKDGGGGTLSFAWFVWERGYSGEPLIGWIVRHGSKEERK